jgi:hypothetical protein
MRPIFPARMARVFGRYNQLRLTAAIAQCSLPPASVPIPKFARFFGTFSCELRNQKDTRDEVASCSALVIFSSGNGSSRPL